jgi:hypothetical protein
LLTEPSHLRDLCAAYATDSLDLKYRHHANRRIFEDTAQFRITANNPTKLLGRGTFISHERASKGCSIVVSDGAPDKFEPQIILQQQPSRQLDACCRLPSNELDSDALMEEFAKSSGAHMDHVRGGRQGQSLRRISVDVLCDYSKAPMLERIRVYR